MKEERICNQRELESGMERLELIFKRESYALTLNDLDYDYKISDPNLLNNLKVNLSE